ncbi:MAG: PHP domain-containing protein [Ornithinimicrobium sp.]|jgi:predicted metal-dependent phosphoesterase TrpH|uniref:PHP domain-containing protein n=1 Tax=Ornithinimicrobium sp. TaxID=1977084 RepID=UPI0017D7C328|nr:PHP domain-containing protein [Actinomycetota bacterium]
MAGAGQVIDLHTHSTCSDGTQAPADLVRAAARAGVAVLGLTDHDVTAGWQEAGAQAHRLGVSLVPGIEVSCQAGGISVHLLAYLPDPDLPALVHLLQQIRDHRRTRLRTMVGRLVADGYPLDYDEILAHSSPGATLGRPHVADALVRAGAHPDRDRAFAEVLHGRSAYYVRHWAPDVLDAIRTVRAAGGVPVMAHPFARARGRTVADGVIEGMVRAGLAGLEVDHRDHQQADRDHAAELCVRWGLIPTGSSDYHGAGKPNRIAEHTTPVRSLERIVAGATGTALLGAPLP